MAHSKTLFLLSLLFAVVLVISSRASADNEAGVAQTQGGEQVDHQGGRGHNCHYPHCKEGVHGDETHQVETKTETKSGKTGSTITNENADRHKPYKPEPRRCKHWPHCH